MNNRGLSKDSPFMCAAMTDAERKFPWCDLTEKGNLQAFGISLYCKDEAVAPDDDTMNNPFRAVGGGMKKEAGRLCRYRNIPSVKQGNAVGWLSTQLFALLRHRDLTSSSVILHTQKIRSALSSTRS
jgi:hypothetical protein